MTYNQFLDKLVEVQDIEKQDREVYDLQIQRFLVENNLIQFAMKIIKDQGFLPDLQIGEQTENIDDMDDELMDILKGNKEKKSKKDFKFMLLDSDLTDIISIVYNQDITMSQIKGLVFELAISILRTFNKACKRYIYGETYKDLRENHVLLDTIPSWIYDIKESNYVLLELSRFMS